MEKSRYQVVTFRGYDYASFYVDAYEKAQSLIMGIKSDHWADEYWWCRIIDRHKGVSRLVWMRGNYQFNCSQWLALK